VSVAVQGARVWCAAVVPSLVDAVPSAACRGHRLSFAERGGRAWALLLLLLLLRLLPSPLHRARCVQGGRNRTPMRLIRMQRAA
jgi:hypothetical protein